MKKSDVLSNAVYLAGSAVIYALLDIPVRATNFLRYGSMVGIKNFLPPVLGLLLGPSGAVGCAAGAILGSIILPASGSDTAAEALSALICGLVLWLGWHAFPGNRVHLKKTVHYVRYSLLLAASAALSALVCRMITGAWGLALAAGYISMGALVGIPVLVLASSIFCVEPVLPPWRHRRHDVTGAVTADPESVGIFSELLEDALLPEGRVSRRKLFELQNIVEEVSIRVLANLPDTTVTVTVDCDDSCSVKLDYPGARYSPMRMRKGEDEMDLMSLKLIRHRALRASHRYSGGVNHVHIVV